MAKNIYCLEKDTKGKWRKVRVSGIKKPVFSSIETIEGPKTLEKSSVYISVNTSQCAISREFFPKLSRDILEIQVKEKLKQLAFWGDVSDMKIVWKKIAESEKRIELATIACPFREINEIIDLCLVNNLRIKRISHFAVSVARLVGRIVDEPALAVIFDEGVLQLIAIQNNIPFYHQLVPMEMDLVFDQANIKQSVDMAKNSINRIYAANIKRIIVFGEHYKLLEEVLTDYDVMNPKWDNVLICDSLEDLRKYPALFGAYFVDQSYNMLTPSIAASYFIDDLLRASGYISIAASVFLMLFIYKLYVDNKFLKSEFTRLSSKIGADMAELSSKYPSQAEKENIEKFVSIFEKYKEHQRLDNFIIEIAASLPPDVIVKSLSMTFPMVDAQSRQINLSSGKWSEELQSILGNGYSLDLKLATKGSYSKALKELNSAKKKLTDIFFLENAVINYEEKNSEGILTCSLKSKKTPEPMSVNTEAPIMKRR